MSKAPAFQFYVKDWMADLAEHPLEIEGAWCRFCAKAWLSETPGELWCTMDQWARLWRVDGEDALRIWRYIVEEKIGDSDTDLTDFSRDSHAKIHLACRRMVREEKDKEGDRIRQRRRYEKKKSDPIPHADSHAGYHEKLTSPSSSASATAKKENNRVSPLPPKGGEGQTLLPPSPEDDPDLTPETEISSLNDCAIEFQELAEAFQLVGGCVDVVPAYTAYEAMHHRFPLARIVDDLEQRKTCDQWQRGRIPKLSNYLRDRVWLNPIPAARASPKPQPRTYQDHQREERRADAIALAHDFGIGGENVGTDKAACVECNAVLQHEAAEYPSKNQRRAGTS